MKCTIRVLSILLFRLCLLLSVFYNGCSGTDNVPCSTSTDCPEGFTCRGKLCYQICKFDEDCPNRLLCKENICGGLKILDAGDIEPVVECVAGQTQECYAGLEETLGKGVCKAGEQTCMESGFWGDCVGQTTPEAEICDGKDNDCDEQTDEESCAESDCKAGETQPCYSGSEESKKHLPCKSGLQRCVLSEQNKRWEWGLECEDEVLPIGTEICNDSIDNDCDGEVNEGCLCKPGESAPCQAENKCLGIKVCLAMSSGGTEWGVCNARRPSIEVCDGQDNDCDGKTDNVKDSDEKITRECSNGCIDKGTEICIEKDGKILWGECNARKPKEKEECNGVDDDCDGKVDNVKNKDVPIIKGCSDTTDAQGICKTAATQTCKDARWAACIPGNKANERCNGFDDDCDGNIDVGEEVCPEGQTCTKRDDGTSICL